MGQYYRFVNITKQENSEISLPFNFGLPWVKNLQDASLTELQTVFDFVLEHNHWQPTDDVIAHGDYGDVICSPYQSKTNATAAMALMLQENKMEYQAFPEKTRITEPFMLQPEKAYTFSDFFTSNLPIDKVTAYFGYQYQRTRLLLPKQEQSLDRVDDLRRRLEENLARVNLTNEAARREFLIAPVLAELLHYTTARLSVELPLMVTKQLQGTLDYYLEANQQLLIIEAKNADLQRGFTQLSVELIALAQANNQSATNQFYGVISIGDVWQFGLLDTLNKQVRQDINLFRVPEDVKDLLQVLIALLQ